MDSNCLPDSGIRGGFYSGGGKVYKGKGKEARESISLSHEIPPPSDTEPLQGYKELKELEEGSIIGRVIGQDTEEGIAKVPLTLFSADKDYTRYTSTDEDGLYRFDSLPPQLYEIYYALGIPELEDLPYVVPSDNFVEVEVPAEGGELKAPDIVLEVGGKVKVRVLKADGKTLMEEDKVERVRVVIPNYKGKYWGTSTRGMIRAYRGEDRTYLIDRVPETDSAELEAWVYGYMNTLKKGIRVKAGKTTEVIDIIVNTDDPTGITGVVTAKVDGRPIEGARVDVDIPARPTDPATNPVASAITDRDGRYIIRGVQPGFYSIFSLHASFNALSKKKPIEVIKEKQTIVNIKLPPRAEPGTGSYVNYAEDPKAVFSPDSGCTVDQKRLLSAAFNSAMFKFQECLDSIWEPLEGKGEIEIYCEPCEKCGSAVRGGEKITICIRDKTFTCSATLPQTLLHESVHLVGKGENDAYTCEYHCYRWPGCVACVPKAKITVLECRGEELTMENTCDARYKEPACPNPSEGKKCDRCDIDKRECVSECPSRKLKSSEVTGCTVCNTYEEYDCEKACAPYVNTECYPSPGCDNPDENESDSSSLTGTILNYDSTSPIGVLFSPSLPIMFDLLASFKEKATIVYPEEVSPSLLDKVRLLIIPSGGLMGLSNSNLFKQALAEYVALGGSVISMTQQVGEEFSILPGEPSGDGWTEDTSCIYMSGYMYNNHQILAGQFTDKPWLHVDGRIYSFPPNATEILRRTSGAGDILISYPYGNGNVIASTLYSDYSSVLGGATAAEMALVRDMVSWARRPMLLPEAMLGETVNYELQITNVEENTQLATTVVVDILDPSRSATQSTQTFPISLSPGESTSISISYQTEETSALGIWHTRYTLFNEEGELIQPPLEEDTGRFAIISPTISDLPELEFFVDSDADKYLQGTDATFTISIKNNTDVDRMLSVSYFLDIIYYDFGSVLIPGQQTVELSISAKVYQTSIFVVYFNELNGVRIGLAFKSYIVNTPSVSLTINPDKQEYGRGEMVNLELELKNLLNFGYDTIVDLIVSDPDNVTVYLTSLPLTLNPSQVITETINFPLAMDAAFGNYNVEAAVYDSSGEKIGIALTYFKLPMPLLSVIPILPPVFSEQNYVEFEVINIGLQDVTCPPETGPVCMIQL